MKDNLLSHTPFTHHTFLWKVIRSQVSWYSTSWYSPAGGCSWQGWTEIHADQSLGEEQTSQRRRFPMHSCLDLVSC